MSAQVEIRGVRKAYAAVRVLHDLNLVVRQGEFLSLLGPSGCGKTTSLNIVAGFVTPDAGDVLIGGQSVTRLPPYRRNLGMVFQRYTLFPHMSVLDNVAFGLRLRKVPRREVARRVRDMLELVRLPDVADRFPSELSGGQQQRIALARALVVEPRVLLLDEPLSNLDAKLRREMQIEIRRIHEKLGLTTVYVTHDQEESLVLSDRVAVMHQGTIAQLDAPRAIYDRPRTRFVAGFIGETNFFVGRVVEHTATRVLVKLPGPAAVTIETQGKLDRFEAGAAIELIVREERIKLSRQPAGPNAIPVQVTRVVFRGAMQQYFLQSGEMELRASTAVGAGERFQVGESGFAIVPPDALVMLEASAGGNGVHAL